MMPEIIALPPSLMLLEPGSPGFEKDKEQRALLRQRTEELGPRHWGKWLIGGVLGTEVELPTVPYDGRNLSEEAVINLAEEAVDGTHGLPSKWKDGYLRTKAAVLLGMSALKKPDGADVETAKRAADYLVTLSRRGDGAGSLLAAKILLHKLSSF